MRASPPSIVVLILILAVACKCDDELKSATVQDEETRRAALASRQSQEFVARYKLYTEDQTLAKLRSESVLKWSNPAAGSVYGDVFLWTHAGRPFAAASMFQWFSPHTHRSHEFVSFADSPITCDFDSREVWRTTKPGINFQQLSDAQPPAATPALRLVQMRSLAKEFTATKLDRDEQSQELRLLTQPVYRYPTEATTLDGTLFVFVQGTDPEIWLLLEAQKHDGAYKWFFGAARMNSVDFTLNRRGAKVWHNGVLSWSEVYSHHETYTSFGGKEIPQPD